MSTGFTIPNSDINFPYSVSVGNYQRTPTRPGTIYYNPVTDKIEGYVENTRAYNNSKFLPLTLDAASTTELGGIKVGNNLAITADGTLNAVAESSTQKFQKILSVSPYDNVADYTSINQCLTSFFGYDPVTNTFPDGELAGLDPSDYPTPSATTRYIVHLMPGTYTESASTINIPPYVTIIGENRDSVFINVDNTTQINCYSNSGGGQQIANLTINLNNTQTAATTAIETANCSNILISNVKFTLTSPSGYNITAINMSSGSNNVLSHVETDISGVTASNNEEITLLTASATTAKLKNCDISLSAHRGLKRIINASSDSTITVQDTTMTITETNNTTSTHRNECILLADSDLNIKRSNLSASGYDLLLNDDDHNNRTIILNNTTAKATTTQTAVTFTHYEDATQYDEILCELATLDFSSLFTTGDVISISGADELQNNKHVTIVKIYTEDISGTDYSIIQVSKQDQLVDETFNNPSGVTIKSLYTVNINNTQLSSTNNIIKSLDLNSHSFIRIANSDLDGDSIDIGNNKIVFNTRQVIRVGKQNADFASIYDALQSINDNNAVQRYMIYVLPGEYYEQQQLVIPEYVSIVGESSKNTLVYFDTNTGAYPDNVAVKLSSNSSIENLGFSQSVALDATELILIGSNNLDVVEGSATSITNCEIYNCNITITSNPATTINVFKLMKTTASITKLTVTATIKSATAAAQDFRVFNNILSNLKVYDMVANVDGLLVETADTTVFNNDRTVMTCENPIITLATSGSSDVVNIVAKCENTAEADITLTDVSPYTNIIQGGMIRVYNGTTNYALYSDYNATLFTRNLTYQGAKFLRNNENNDYPNSFLKTLTSYRISVDGSNNIYNISATDNYGSSVEETENVLEGEDVGTFIMSGTKNILFGIRLGGQLTTGSRNVMMGVDLGNHDYSISDNVLLGINAGNVITDNKHVIIGSNTASQMRTGTRDIIIGYNAASSANNVTDITVMGVNSALQLNNASNLVVIGNETAPLLGDGTRSVIMGTHTATSLTDGEKNVIIGNETLTSVVDIDDAVIMGNQTAANVTSGNQSVIIGANAAENITTITNSVVMGKSAGRGTSTTASDKVVVIGHEAGLNMGSVTKSVIIGSNVGQQMSSDATMNMVIGGYGSANELTSGSNNMVLGSYSASALTTGQRNIIMGNHSGQSLDTTDDTIILGHNSGSNISGGNDSDDKAIIIGNDAGQFLTDGGVIFIGHEAGQKATGEDSIIIGNRAGRTISGARNTLIGNYTAGISSNPVTNPVEGHDNIVIGNRAGFELTTGNYNVVVGSGDASNGSAGNNLRDGEGNMIMGYRAGRNLVDGDYNFLFGREAGFNLNDGSRNFIMGDRAGYRLNSGGDANDNMVIGNYAAYNLTEGEGILMIGLEAGYNASTGNDNLFIGKKAGYENSSGSQNIFIGNDAGYNNTLNQNTMIGVAAGKFSTTAERNTFIGFNAGRGKGESVSDNNTGDQNIAIGYEAGSNLVSGYQSLLIGNNAGRNNESGAKNIMIGPNAGQNSTASRNIFIGSTDSNTGGVGIQTSGEYNIFLGVSVGENNTTGSESVIIGSHAGNKNTTGSNSIFIGNDAGKENTIGDGNIKIGKEAGRDGTTGSNNVIIGPEAAKSGTSNSAVIIGKQAGMLNQSDNQIFIGPEAGKANTTGSGSIMIGSRAGLLNEQGKNNIFIGENTGSSFRRTGDTLGENIYIGSNTGVNNTTGIRNIIIGTETFENSSNGSGVIAIGYRAGRNTGMTDNAGDSYNNIMIGQNAVSTGDIGLNNTMIGSNVGRNVDNGNKFVGNAMIGADAGLNANLAINSVVLGNSNRIGTGGENNILAGFSAGDNLGNTNFIRVATSQDLERGQNYLRINDTVITYGKIAEHFELGDNILIVDTNNTNFESYITKIENIADGGSYYTKISLADFYDADTAINSGALLFPLAKVDEENIGFTDRSKASSNTLMGNAAAVHLKKGSKNVALGDQSMHNNEVGKYNNVLGTEAGYNLKTDNNTLFGTKTGYSLDSYIGNTAVNATYRGFSITDNTITFGNGGTSYSNIADIYSLNEIIELDNTSGNNDRYKIFNTTSNSITVEGLPKIDELGVEDTVNPNALIINGSTYNFSNINVNADTFSVLKGIGTTNNYSYTYIKNPAETLGTSFDKTYAIEIEGSIYNDGLHYLFKDSSGSDSKFLRTYSTLHPEVFDSNVSIKSKSITSPNLITGTATSFYNINENSIVSSFLGTVKGLYTVNNKETKFNKTKLINETIFVNDIPYEVNNYVNVLFVEGYNESFTIDNDDTTLVKYDDFFVNTGIEIDASNGTITFDNPVTLSTGTSEYYYLSGTSNNNKLVKITNELSTDKTQYNIAAVTGSLTTESITSNATNPVYFRRQELYGFSNDVSTVFNTGSIINMNINNYIGLKCENGSFLTETSTDSSLLLNNTSTIPALYDKFGTYGTGFYGISFIKKDVELNINKDIYKVDSGYLADKDNQVSGYDIFFQTGSITNTDAGTFTLHSSNNHITSTVKYGFKDLLAPCMIKLDSKYYLVEANKYPFQKLEINTGYTVSDGTTTSDIEYHSACVNQSSSNLALLEQGTSYKVFGNEKNNNIEITPVSDATAISRTSVYLTSTSNIVNQSGNDKMLLIESVHSDYVSYIAGAGSYFGEAYLSTNSGPGYFKHLDIDSANISINYNTSSTGSSAEYENIASLTYDKINQKKVILIPDTTSTIKYKMMIYDTPDTFETMTSPIDTFDGTNVLNSITTLVNGFTLYGKTFIDFKISTYGYLLFEDTDNNIFTVNFLTRNIETNYITAADTNSEINTKIISSASGTNDVLVIDFASDASGSSGYNNTQIKLYLNNALSEYQGIIEINYSKTNLVRYEYNLQTLNYIIGMENSFTQYKENRVEDITNGNTTVTPFKSVNSSTISSVNNKTLVFDPQRTFEGFKLTAYDGTTNYEYGQGLSIESNIIAVGDYNDAYLYDITTFNVSSIQSTVIKIDPSISDSSISNQHNFGKHIKIKNNKLISAFYDDTYVYIDGINSASLIHIYDLTTFIESSIISSNVTYREISKTSDKFGEAITVSGNKLIVGDYGYKSNDFTSNNDGRVIFYDIPNIGINQPFSINRISTNNLYGYSAASTDNFALIGEIGSSGINGRVCIYDITEYDNSNVSASEIFLVASDYSSDDKFGSACKINSSNIAVIGATGSNNSSDVTTGAVYLYDLNTTYDATLISSTEIKITPFDGYSGDEFGKYLELSSNTLLVGTGNSSQGVYKYDISSLNKIDILSSVVKIQPYDSVTDNNFGSTMAISGDKLMIGAPLDDISGNSNVGSVYMYDMTSNYSLQQNSIIFNSSLINDSKVILPTNTLFNNDKYGSDLYVTSKYVFVGHSNFALNKGVYMYDINDYNNYIVITEDIIPLNLGNSINYGEAIAANDNYLAISDKSNGSGYIGCVYLYDISNFDLDTILESKKILVPYDAATKFGTSLDMHDNTLIVSASDSNAIYLYDLTNFDLVNINASNIKITANESYNQYNPRYGYAVSAHNNILAVGAYNDTDGETWQSADGSVYLYDISYYDPNDKVNSYNNIINSKIKLRAYDKDDDDFNFGYSVSIYNNKLAVGSPDNSSVYLYDVSSYNLNDINLSNIKISTSSINYGKDIHITNNLLAIASGSNTHLYDISNFTNDYIINNSTILTNNVTNQFLELDNNVFIHDNLLFVSDVTYNSYSGIVEVYNIFKTYEENQYYNITKLNYTEQSLLLNNIKYINDNNIILGTTEPSYGFSVTLNSNILAVGVPYFNNSQGEVYLYNIENFDYNSIETSNINLTEYTPVNGNEYGKSINISNNMLVVGTDIEVGTGYVYLYDLTNFNSSSINNSNIRLNAYDDTGTNNQNYGHDVFIDSNILAVSAIHDNGSSGSVYLYDISSYNINDLETSKDLIENSNIKIQSITDNNTNFGYKLFINNNILFASTNHDYTSTGNVYMFDISDFKNKTAIDIKNSSINISPFYESHSVNYGYSIYADNNILSVGNNNGTVYLYNISNYDVNDLITSKELIENSNIILTFPTGTQFGKTVNINNNILYVSDNDTLLGYETVYLYDLTNFDNDSIILSKRIINQNISISGYYGHAMASYNNKLVIGAYDSTFNNPGATGNIYLYDLNSYYNTYRTDISYSNTTADILQLTNVELGEEFNYVFNNFSNIDIKLNGQILFKTNTYQYYYNPLNTAISFDKLYYKVESEYLDLVFEKNNSVVKTKLYLDNNFATGKITSSYYNIDEEFSTANGTVGINTNFYNDYSKTAISESNKYQITFNNVGDYQSTFDLLTSNDFVKMDYFNNQQKQIQSIGDDYIIIYDENVELSVNQTSNLIVNQYVGYDSNTSINKPRFDFEKARRMAGEHTDFLRFCKLRQRDLINVYDNEDLTHDNQTFIPTSYTEPQAVTNVIDSTLNFSVDTSVFDSDNTFTTGINTTHIIPLKETVPNEYTASVIDTSNVNLINDKYAIALGEPVFDAGSNLILQKQNINTPIKGFNDVFANDNSSSTFNNNIIFHSNYTLTINGVSNPEKYTGNITITATSIVLEDLEPESTNYVIPSQNFGGIKKASFLQPFKKLKPGNIISIFSGSSFINTTYDASNYLIKSVSADGLTIDYDSNFNNTTLTKTAFSSSSPIKIQIANFINDASSLTLNGQLINERINFANFTKIQSASVSSYYNDLYITIVENPMLEIEEIYHESESHSYNYVIPNYSMNESNITTFISSYNSSTPLNTLMFLSETYGLINDMKTILDYGAHTMIIPSSNISLNVNGTNVFFKNSDQTSQNITIDISSNVIQNDTGGTIDFTDFTNGQLFRIFNSSTSKSLIYKVHDTDTITSGSLPLDASYGTMDYNTSYVSGVIGEGFTQYNIASANIYSSVMMSSDTSMTDLSIYKQGMSVIVSRTTNNNGTYNLTDGSISTTACNLLDETVTDETPDYCLIHKVVLTPEDGVIENVDVDIDVTANTVTINDTNTFNNFIAGQSIYIENSSSNDGSYSISDTVYPTDTVIYLDGGLVSDELATTINIVKNITIKKIGIPITSINNNQVSIFHYEDAQGNNMMLGSFTGQFCGSKNLAIHNTYIGNKVGQTNHGSGNLFFGSETGLAVRATDAESFYNNKLAIYKNNFIGVPNKPLIGGDFGTGRVGINTIDPDSLVSSGTLESTTRLVVNGAVRASAHSTFTGTHIIVLAENISESTLIPGMCMVSSGHSQKLRTGILDTIVTCQPSDKANDKRVYGIYSHNEDVSGAKQYYVASVGEGMILVCNVNGEPENGDYVCTSSVRGLAQLQSDDLLHNYTVAKITEDIDWSQEYNTVIYNGTAYKFKLASCTYHCG